MHRSYDSHFGRYGSTSDQFVLLTVLAEESGLIQQELARRVSSDANTIAAMLNRLEARGLVERKPHDVDGRARCVHITVKGRRLQHKLYESARLLNDRLDGSIAPEQLEVVLNALQRIAGAMNGYNE